MADGFDADVLLCPGHVWVEGDDGPEYLNRCSECGADRCRSGDGDLRCLEPVHHVLLPHRVSSGNKWPVGMNPSDSIADGVHLHEVVKNRRLRND